MSAAFNLAESDTERPPWIQLFGIEIVGVTVTALGRERGSYGR